MMLVRHGTPRLRQRIFDCRQAAAARLIPMTSRVVLTHTSGPLEHSSLLGRLQSFTPPPKFVIRIRPMSPIHISVLSEREDRPTLFFCNESQNKVPVLPQPYGPARLRVTASNHHLACFSIVDLRQAGIREVYRLNSTCSASEVALGVTA
jgi:hypothetical protein